MLTFESSCVLPVSAEEAFAWHERPGAFERLTPPWQSVEVVERSGTLSEGDRLVLRLRLGPLHRLWVAEHHDSVPGRRFVDVQREGPFAHWRHSHTFEPITADGCRLVDRIELRPPGGTFAEAVLGGAIRNQLGRTFAYRHRVLKADLESQRRRAKSPRLRVAISGASGLIGRTIEALLTTGGHHVIRLVRRCDSPTAPNEVRWDARGGVDTHDLDRLEGIDCVVHLAGENLAGGRWTAERRRRIRDSRVAATSSLVRSLGALRTPPRDFLCASAVGIYGLDVGSGASEDAPPGSGFLAEVCVAWEEAARQATRLGCRVVHLRFGVVLSPEGGALGKMLPAFRLGAAGRIGSGAQVLSWVTRDDAADAVVHLLAHREIAGAVNVTAPEPIANAELTATLGRILRRPTLVPLPAAAVRLVFGAMGEETLLGSCRALPTRLTGSGYRFRHPRLAEALRHLLGREPPTPDPGGASDPA